MKHVCQHCGREFTKLRQWQQHVKEREHTGRCRKSVEDAKEVRVKRMTKTNQRKLKTHDKLKARRTTIKDVEDWS